MNLLNEPTSGQVLFEGYESRPQDIDINAVRSQMNMVFQNFNLFMHLTARKNIILGIAKGQEDGPEGGGRLGYGGTEGWD